MIIPNADLNNGDTPCAAPLALPHPSPVARQFFVLLAGLLAAVGMLMVFSSSITSRPTEFEQVYLSRHLTFAVLAFACGAVAAHLPLRFWHKAAPWLYALTLILLVLVMVPGLGTRVNGAQRWLRIGSISLQPSETAKLTIPLLVGLGLARDSRSYYGEIIRLLAPVVLVCVLIAQEPDLGTATFVALTATLALFLGRWPLQNFLFGALAALPPTFLFVAMRPYQLERIEGFIAVWRDFAQAPYQIRQSLTTLGTGGWWGTGLGSGWQKLSFLPEANTDFVFAVVGEELGLAGTLSVVALWIGFYVTGLRVIAPLPRESSEYVISLTMLNMLVLQAAINVAVVTAMLPPKGISHPFISYGGSNLVVSAAVVGVILSLTANPTAVESSLTTMDVHESVEEHCCQTVEQFAPDG